MTKKRRTKYVARLRNHYEFKVAAPWCLEWLGEMSHQEQRWIADELDECSLENCLFWWARNEFFLHCPDSIVRWRAIWWSAPDRNPRISYARQLAHPGEYMMTNFDDSVLFEYDPYAGANDNVRKTSRTVH